MLVFVVMLVLMSVFLFDVNVDVGVVLAVGVYLDVIGAVVVVDNDVGVAVRVVFTL